MKKPILILSLILCAVLFVFAFASCGGAKNGGTVTDAATMPGTTPGTDAATILGTTPGTTPGTDAATIPGTAPGTDAATARDTTPGTAPVDGSVTVYASGVTPAIVISSKMITSDARENVLILRNTLNNRTGANPPFGADSKVEKTGVEIVFGQTDRAITERANAILPAQSGDEAAYAIYFDADGAAVVWNHKYASEVGVKYFVEQYCGGDTLTVEAGTTAVVRFSISEYEEELRLAAEEKARQEEEARQARVERQYAARFDVIADPEVREAVKGFYEEFYDPEKLIRWWAGLYDPDRGGFYYANSARDNDGFLPDMESTLQIVQRLRGFDSGNDLARYLGPDITAKMIKFYQDMQDPDDGYFYHPQWTKAQSRQNVMRYTRDQDWAIAVLSWLHSEPLYPTALDRAKGSAGVYDATVVRLASQSGLTRSAGGSTVTVKPRVGLDWQPNETSVKQYVNSLLDTTSCEHWGNQLDTQISSFEAAGVLDYVLDVLDERVNPDFGLWVTDYNESSKRYTNLAGNSETPYGICTNTYKIMKVYNAGNRLFKYSTKMVENTIKAINLRDPGARVTYIFNPWATLAGIHTNLKNYGTARMRNQYTDLISENFLEMIDSLKSTLGAYRCEDGSYGFLQSGSSPTIYSTPVSLGLKEGDVNATNLVVSFAQHICNTIGLDETIPVFNENHGKLMKELLDNAPSIEKGPETVTSVVTYGFDSDKVGETPEGMTDSGTSGTTFKVRREPGNTSNKVLEIKKDTEGNDGGGTLTVPTLTVPKMDDSTILEIKMRVNVTSETRYGYNISGSNPNIMQMRVMSDQTPFWMPTLRFNSDATGYTLVAGKNTNTNLIDTINTKKTFAFDVWYEFTFRLTIKNFGKSNAEFKVEIDVDGESYGTSTCFYANDDYSSLTSGTITFREGKTVNVRFAPQMRIHADILIDDLVVTYSAQ